MRRAAAKAAWSLIGALWLAGTQLAALPADGLGGRMPAFGGHGASDVEPADTSREIEGTDHVRSPDLRPKGIRPPWRDHWIPELRHVPGKKARKFTAEVT